LGRVLEGEKKESSIEDDPELLNISRARSWNDDAEEGT